MSIWEILEIEETDSVRDIRRAYSNSLKKYHPEDDPEQFALVKDAYEKAIRYARKKDSDKRQQDSRSHTSTLSMPEKVLVTFDGGREEPKKEEQPSFLAKLDELQEHSPRMDDVAKEAFLAFQKIANDETVRENRDIWKAYFLSKEFLRAQFHAEVLQSIREYLCHNGLRFWDNFIIELVIAYDIIIEADDLVLIYNEKSEQDVLHGAAKVVAEIWNAMPGEWRNNQGRTLLEQEGSLLRKKTFGNYLRLRSMSESGMLTEEYKKEWGYQLLECGKWIYLVSGESQKNQITEGDARRYIRDVSLLTLYTFFVEECGAPDVVCRYMYNEYELHQIGHKHYSENYISLKNAILKQFPQIQSEQKLRQVGREQRFLLKSKMGLLQKKYDYSGWGDTRMWMNEMLFATKNVEISDQQVREIDELIHSDLFQTLMYDPIVLEFTYGPSLLTEKVYQEYLKEDDMDEKVEMLMLQLMEQITIYHRIPEYNCMEPYTYHIEEETEEYWYYFFQAGFKNGVFLPVFKYVENVSLAEYIERIYKPSRQWRTEFLGFDLRTGEYHAKRERVLLLPDGREIRLIYEMFDIVYFYQETKIEEPFYTFNQLLDYAGGCGQESLFFLLLPLAEIVNEKEAYTEIRRRLTMLPFYEASRDRIASFLAVNTAKQLEEQKNKRNIYGWDEMQRIAGDYMRVIPKPEWRISLESCTNKEKAAAIIEQLRRRGSSYEIYKRKEWVEEYHIPNYAIHFLEEYAWFRSNYIMLTYGNQNRRIFEYLLYTGLLYGDDVPELIREKCSGKTVEYLRNSIRVENYVVGYFLVEWRDPVLFSIGADGKFYSANPNGFRPIAADSLEILLEKIICLDYLTGIQGTCKKPVLDSQKRFLRYHFEMR